MSKARSAVGLMTAVGICLCVSAIGGSITATSVGTWYQGLERPWWTPPGWLFGPVWLSLYTLMAIAAWDVWRKPRPSRRAEVLFFMQLALNLGWSVAFFGLRSPGFAFVEILFLLGFIVATTHEFRRHRGRAALLLVPYLVWTSFAACLNAAIWWLNRGG